MKKLVPLLLVVGVVASLGWGVAWASGNSTQSANSDEPIFRVGQTPLPKKFMMKRQRGPVIPPAPPIVVKPGTFGLMPGDFSTLPGGGSMLAPTGGAGVTVQESNRQIRRLIRRLG